VKDEQLRQTGIGVVGDVPWGTHFFLFHETTQDLIDACVPYFHAGLESRELCLWAIADPLTEEEVRYSLKHSIPGFDGYFESRSIEIVRSREWYMAGEDLDLKRVTDGWKQMIDRALDGGYAGLRVSADTAWLEKRHRKAFSQYEKEVNESMVDTQMLALCTYPLRGTAAAEILDVTRTHHFAIALRNRVWEVLETAELTQAKAEILRINNQLERRVAERTRELMAVNQDLQRAEDQLKTSFNQLRALTARLQSIREEERKRVAREIHDDLGQSLTSIKIDLASLIRTLPAGQISESKAESILRLVDQAIQSVRRIATELRPGILDDLGLVAAVEWAAEEFAARSGARLRLDFPQEDLVIDPGSATAIFRIFQETLTNVTRHANATEVEVRLAKEDDSIALEVRDNGRGMDEELATGRSLGILGMRERALLLKGKLTIHSAPGQGTAVTIRIPIHAARRTGAGT
jgi:signal transduction histidine kinase